MAHSSVKARLKLFTDSKWPDLLFPRRLFWTRIKSKTFSHLHIDYAKVNARHCKPDVFLDFKRKNDWLSCSSLVTQRDKFQFFEVCSSHRNFQHLIFFWKSLAHRVEILYFSKSRASKALSGISSKMNGQNLQTSFRFCIKNWHWRSFITARVFYANLSHPSHFTKAWCFSSEIWYYLY